ncbi:hypothetical protein DFH09DRAFT_1433808 [Mycena vulgaris]|nr:hypothetical protein DFH09DRAFT_1433808 [Mycena vulgaris]
MGWIGAHTTRVPSPLSRARTLTFPDFSCGISETHVAHHVCSKIPHYNAWGASDALRAVLKPAGLRWQGGAGGWAEMYRVFRECKFVEDEGDVVFFKNAQGLAKMRPVFNDSGASDSGVEIVDKRG